VGGVALSPASPVRQGEPYLLDTHVWIWYLLGSERLPAGVRRAIDRSASELWLSPISIWELGMLHARGRIEVQGGPRAWYLEAQRRLPLREAALTSEAALLSLEIELGHRDPADHLIAATALAYGLTLLTLDERMLGLDWLPALGR
jgi:PIN domain nuclease of toxin-antitoxin system